ncbi:hypothetical protein [Sphingopyxis sp. KK2]|uniref:hypothetical protein n=1 Tax=Sphingopyxis sp. KK2 TaxID=1855727 RepID=UPI00097E5C5A|nr:hypothetical protein [Sphingopyxis sp. KK2]
MDFSIRKLATRQFWRPVTQAFFLIATGAWLVVSYIATHMPSVDFLKDLRHDVQLGWWILFVAWCATAPGNKAAYKDPGPARSGTAVVAVCGVAAAIVFSQGADWPTGFIVPGLILLGTVVIATLVYRFASRHESEIGEARFDTIATSPHRDG